MIEKKLKSLGGRVLSECCSLLLQRGRALAARRDLWLLLVTGLRKIWPNSRQDNGLLRVRLPVPLVGVGFGVRTREGAV